MHNHRLLKFPGRTFLSVVPIVAASILLVSCSALKLDKESNCLNEKAACFKWDVTRPKLDSAVEPQAGQIVSLLPYIDLRFSEELKEPTAADFQLLDVGAISLKIMSVEKVANFTYRLNLSGSVQNGPIRVRFTNLKDYAGNILSGIDEVQYTGNVDISVVFDFDSVTNPNFHAGVSNWVTGGYRNTTIKWYHDYTSDPGNTYQVFVTTGSISCPATLTGGPLAGGAANTQTQTFDRTADFTSGPRSYRIVVCIKNESQNKKGVGSVLIVRDDDPPDVSHLPLDGEYNSPQSFSISCAPNKDKIYYSSNSFPNWTGLATDPTNPADPYNNATGALAGGLLYTGPVTTPNPSNPTRTKYRYGCFDIAGNWSTVAASTAPIYVVDTTLPEVSVTLGNGYSGYVSAGGYTSTTLEFTTNQSGTPYRIVSGATSCAALDGASLIGAGPFTTPAAGTLISHTIPAASFSTASGGVNNVYICVQNPAGTKWGAATLQVVRDDVRPTTSISVGTGSYGAQQSVVVTCDDNADKIAYTTDGTTPSFFANGQIQNGLSHTGPFTTPEGVTTFKYLCRDKAGNEELAVATQVYTVDSLLPTITVLSNSNPAISTSGSKTSTTISWRSSRASRPFSFRVGGTNCTTATQLTPAGSYTGTTAADTNTVHTTQINAADLGTDGSYTIRICVTNLVGDYGSASFTQMKDTTAPVIAAIDATPALAAVDATNFTLSWAPATDTGGSGVAMYRIFRSLTSNAYAGYPNIPDYSAPTSPATITLPDTQKYFLRIVPVDAAGNIAGGAIPYYNELTTKPSINIVLTGNSGPLMLTDGSQSPVSVASSMAWTTTLGTGSTYTFNITSQPSGQVCAIKEKQFGTLSSNLTITVNCINGAIVGGTYQAQSGAALDYRLFQGKVSTNFFSAVAPVRGIVYLGGNIYYGVNGALRRVTAALVDSQILAFSGTVQDMATDGTNIYLAEWNGRNKLWKVNPAGPTATLLVGADGAGGSADGPAATAQLDTPYGVALYGKYLFFTEFTGKRLRHLDLTTGNVTTLYTHGSNAITDVAVTSTGVYFAVMNELYTASFNPVTGTIGSPSVLAGSATSGYIDAVGTNARFDYIHALITEGTNVFVTEYTGNRVRRVNIRTGRVTTIAGDGTANNANGVGAFAQFTNPQGITTDGRVLYVSNNDGGIRKMTDNGLVGYWPLTATWGDYNSDNSVQSALSQATAATVPSDAGRITGQAAGSYQFGGTRSLVTGADTGLPMSTAARSVCVWAYPTSLPSNTSAVMVDYGTYATNRENFLSLVNQSGINYLVYGGYGNDLQVTYTAGLNQWTHFCGTFDGSVARVYANGVLLGEYNPLVAKGTNWGTTSGGYLKIGGGIGSITANPFSGSLSDVRVYARVLSEGEINELAQDATPALVGNTYSSGATGLLAHYTFTSGVENLPSGPVGGNLSIVGTKTTTTGKDGDPNNAISYSGTNNFHTAQSAMGLPSGSSPRTHCAWVKPSSYPSVAMPIYVILRYGDTGALGGCSDLLMQYSAGGQQLAFGSCGASAAEYTTVNHTLPLNTWSHVCGTLAPGSNVTIYVNGASVINTSGITTNWQTGPAGLTLQIGDFNGVGGYPFAGAIDDVRIYNDALTAAQIQRLSAQVPAGLVARYALEDTTDTSGLANHMSGAGPTQTDDRFGLNSRAYKFSGGGGYLSAGSLRHVANNATFAAWIKPNSVASAYTGIFENYSGVVGTSGGNGGGLIVNTSGELYFLAKGNGADSDCSVSYVPPVGVYTHVAAVVDSAGSPLTIKLYVNGGLVRTCNPTSAPDFNNSTPLRIGQSVWPTTFDGNIDDARVYNRALSANEVLALVQQPNKRIYVTGTAYNGNLMNTGGVPLAPTSITSGADGADAKCNWGSEPNRLSTSFAFKAMLVDGVKRRACTTGSCSGGAAENIDWVMRGNTTYLQENGLTPIGTTNSAGVFAFPVSSFFSGSIAGSAWTALSTNWTIATSGSDLDCVDWTFNGGGNQGTFGQTNIATSTAIMQSLANCNTAMRLYCVEQ